MQSYTVACFQLRALVQALASLGLDVPRLAQRAELELCRLDDADARFPELALLRMWMLAEQEYTGELLGLHAAAAIPFGALEIVDYLLGASETVGDAFHELARFAALCASGLTYAIEPSGTDGAEGFAVSMQHPYGFELWPTGIVDYLWTCVVTRLRLRLGDRVRPTLRLRHGPGGAPATYRRVLGSVTFGCPRSELFLSRDDWTRPNPCADPALSALLTRYAAQLFERLPRSDDPLERARCAITTKLRTGEPTLERVALDLGFTARTLQRRLIEYGYTFKSLLDEVREELACAYLTKTKLSLSEITYLLGYSDASAFSRAFRRWTGQTPAEYRHAPPADAAARAEPGGALSALSLARS